VGGQAPADLVAVHSIHGSRIFGRMRGLFRSTGWLAGLVSAGCLLAAPAAQAGWLPPVDISEPGGHVGSPNVVLDSQGNATAVWDRWNGTDTVVESAYRPAGEGWQELAGRTLAALEGARRLLDVGCGTGRFAVLAAERLGGRVWGVDASDEMLHEARSRPGAERVGWRRADAAELPFKPGWFDAVHSHLVLHLVADRAAAVAEIARVLGPGGRVVVGTFAPEHFRAFFLNEYFPSIPAIDLCRFPDPDGLSAELTAAGFDQAGDPSQPGPTMPTASRRTAICCAASISRMAMPMCVSSRP